MPKVKLYSTNTCAYCRAEKAFLDQKGVPYETLMVDEDQTALMEMMKLSGMSAVPFNVVLGDDDKVIDQFVGFDQPRLTQALGLT
jgi:glutaredoxin 3